MLYRSKLYRTGLKAGVLLTAVVFGLAHAALAATPTTTVAPLILSGRQSDRPAGTYSAGITEIIKLLDARVILAYIQNSPIPYNPDATELIALKEHGASTETMVALLHHGDQLRLQLSQAQNAANPPSVAPAYDYPPAAYAPYSSGYDDSSYAPIPPTDDGYASGCPLAYWPSVGISGCGPYGYAPGRYYARSGYGYHLEDGGRDARPAPQAPPSFPAPSGEHMSSQVVHSGGSQGSSHSGGRSAGRSR